MLTVTQRLMSGLGQAGSDWAWSVSINDIASSASISYSPPQVTEASYASEEPVSEPKTTHDHSSDTSALQDLYVSDS
jgi:hypothetical protein